MKKKSNKKKKQPKLTRLTRDQRYEIKIISQKKKSKKNHKAQGSIT
jgi:hypothetical protein